MGIFDWFVSKPPSREKFAELVMAALKRRNVSNTYDATNFRLLLGTDHQWNLHNAHAEYCAANKQERPALFERFLQMIAALPEETPVDFEIAKPNLRPRLWMKAALANVNLQAAVDGNVKDVAFNEQPIGSH